MKRLAFILVALACCVVSARQAFTPRRPFVHALASSGGGGIQLPTDFPGLSNWWVWTDMPITNVMVTNWVDRISSNTWSTELTDSRWWVTNTVQGVHFVKNWLVTYQTLSGSVPVGSNATVWFQMSREQTSDFGYLIGTKSANPINWYWHDVPSGWAYQQNAAIQEGLYPDSGPGVIFDHCVVYSNYSQFYYTNGLLAFATNDPAALPNTFTYLGSDSNVTNANNHDFFGGYVLQLAVWQNTALSASNIYSLHLYNEVSTPITIVTQPSSVVCLTNTIASFTISNNDMPSFQWRTNGVNLADGTRWFGVSTNRLWVTNDSVTFTNLAVDCVLSNLWGSVTSSVAYLTVVEGSYYNNSLLSAYDFSAMNKTSGDTLSGLLTGIDSGALHYDLIATNSPVWLTNATINNGAGFVRLVKTSFQNLRTNYSVTYPQPTSLWMVMSNSFTDSTVYQDTSGPGVAEQAVYGGSAGPSVFFHAGGTPKSGVVGGPRWRLFQVNYNGANSFVKTNSALCIPDNNVGSNGRKGVVIGNATTDGYPATMDVTFVAIYTNVLTLGESNNLYNWITVKFPTAVVP